MLQFFLFFTDYTFLYHVIQSRVRLRSPFLLSLYYSDSSRLILFSSPIMLDSYGLTVTLTFYQV